MITVCCTISVTPYIVLPNTFMWRSCTEWFLHAGHFFLFFMQTLRLSYFPVQRSMCHIQPKLQENLFAWVDLLYWFFIWRKSGTFLLSPPPWDGNIGAILWFVPSLREVEWEPRAGAVCEDAMRTALPEAEETEEGDPCSLGLGGLGTHSSRDAASHHWVPLGSRLVFGSPVCGEDRGGCGPMVQCRTVE